MTSQPRDDDIMMTSQIVVTVDGQGQTYNATNSMYKVRIIFYIRRTQIQPPVIICHSFLTILPFSIAHKYSKLVFITY